jgi:glycosyltransferase involved in cell wall biosynthesis
MYEKEFISYADASFIVTPQLKKVMQKWYGLKKIYTLPNAEIYKQYKLLSPSNIKKFARGRVVFLFQGGYGVERGLEFLIHAWRFVDYKKALLVLRGKGNEEYQKKLKIIARDLIDKGSLIFDKPVDSDKLVLGAMEGDIGIIPYEPLRLNGKYCGPNKISQYLQAGIPILCNDLVFIKNIIKKYNCGLSYKSRDLKSFLKCVNYFIFNRKILKQLQRNAYLCGKNYFNWQIQGRIFVQMYKKLLAD